jgi:hypothetical protein
MKQVVMNHLELIIGIAAPFFITGVWWWSKMVYNIIWPLKVKVHDMSFLQHNDNSKKVEIKVKRVYVLVRNKTKTYPQMLLESKLHKGDYFAFRGGELQKTIKQPDGEENWIFISKFDNESDIKQYLTNNVSKIRIVIGRIHSNWFSCYPFEIEEIS